MSQTKLDYYVSQKIYYELLQTKLDVKLSNTKQDNFHRQNQIIVIDKTRLQNVTDKTR